MTAGQQRKWQRIASRASKGTPYLTDPELEVFQALMLDRRQERKAGRPVPSPADLHRVACSILAL